MTKEKVESRKGKKMCIPLMTRSIDFCAFSTSAVSICRLFCSLMTSCFACDISSMAA